MRKLLTSTALIATLSASALMAQSAPQTAGDWDEIQSYLERNPQVMSQLTTMMDREIKPEQIAMDREYIEKNAIAIYEDPMSPVLGNPNGSKIIVKFTDFRCPHCKTAAAEITKLIALDPDVKIVIREFPVLGPDSTEAAKFALAVRLVGGDEAYAKVKSELFETKARMTGYLFEEMAETAGLDPKTVIEAMDSSEILKHLADNVTLARDLKINGTPGLIIGDVVVRGSIPLAAMQRGLAEFEG
jgi:protein-disulfide isomerase